MAAIHRLGFVQADPIRAPARAQDLILFQRIDGYRAGELERRYPELPVAEDVLHVYGFMPLDHLKLVHPRSGGHEWHVEREQPQLRRAVLRHIRRHGATHPRDLERAFGKLSIVNGWGGQSAAATRMLEALQHKGVLRVARREGGIRLYDVAAARGRALGAAARTEALVRLLVNLYAPLPRASLRQLLRMLHDRKPENADTEAAVLRLLRRGVLRNATLDGTEWIWPGDEDPRGEIPECSTERVALVAPFDPLVWDRRRFEMLWGWDYRFEAYTPQPKRRFGYYALPLLWRDAVIGWANLKAVDGALDVETGFVKSRPRGREFTRALDAELDRMRGFLGLQG